jgi:hypothetical protein
MRSAVKNVEEPELLVTWYMVCTAHEGHVALKHDHVTLMFLSGAIFSSSILK